MTTLGSRSKREKRVYSVEKLVKLLEVICAATDATEGPAVPDALRKALASQAQLAALDVPELGLVGMSLNTQKAIADEHHGGYAKLNNLRIAAMNALERQDARRDAVGRDTKEALKLRIADLEEQVGRLYQDLSVLTDAFGKLAAFSRSQAVELADPAALARFQKELRAMEAGLSLLSKPLSTNVTPGDFGGR